MRRALIIGGSSGIGLSITLNLHNYELITIIDKQKPIVNLPNNVIFHQFDLYNTDYSVFDRFLDVDTLIITAGFGRLSLFEDIEEQEIINLFTVNSIGIIRIIKRFYNKLLGQENFYCLVMGSIAGFLSSPMFSVYGATKAALCKFIESVNIELEKSNSTNRILNVSPGSIKGTKFYNGENNPEQTAPLALKIIEQMYQKNDLYIPDYNTTYKDVLKRYHSDFRIFGLESYDYKKRQEAQRNTPSSLN